MIEKQRINGLAEDHPAQKDFNKFMNKKKYSTNMTEFENKLIMILIDINESLKIISRRTITEEYTRGG